MYIPHPLRNEISSTANIPGSLHAVPSNVAAHGVSISSRLSVSGSGAKFYTDRCRPVRNATGSILRRSHQGRSEKIVRGARRDIFCSRESIRCTVQGRRRHPWSQKASSKVPARTYLLYALQRARHLCSPARPAQGPKHALVVVLGCDMQHG